GFAVAVLRLFIIFNSNWDKDEPQSLRYAITPNCSKGADGGQAASLSAAEVWGIASLRKPIAEALANPVREG
ncbi:hypothetical protein H0485_21320, partial [Pseudogemmobacter sp. CC-YST710]|nr:hypothetical protein [Pseudogemmobacter faecipullorum]